MNEKKTLRTLIAITAMISLFLGSCIKDQDFAENERETIDSFLTSNPDLLFTPKESGLYYYEVTAGSGEAINTHDTAYVIYTASFLDGYVIDSNVGRDTFRFPLGEQAVIPGFDEGISYMKEGGKSMFLIPSALAYGASGYYTIPGYTPLLYEVTLTKIARTP